MESSINCLYIKKYFDWETKTKNKFIKKHLLESKIYSRGNGSIGQDLSFLKQFIKLPSEKNILKIFKSCNTAVRGELIFKKSTYNTFTEQNSNARNMISGIVNSKKSSKFNTSTAKQIDFVSYELIEPRLKMSEQIKTLNKMNLKQLW